MLAKTPSLKVIYEKYLLCRSTQMVIFRKPVQGKTDGSERIVTVIWPTGFTQFPSFGGANEQEYVDMRLFSSALRGEQQGVAKLMVKP